jgi:hypothetical protein
MALRETPFGDRGDRYLAYAVLVWGLFFLVLLYSTVTAEENIVRGWLNVGTATALGGGAVVVYGWWRQRRLVDRLDGLAPGVGGDRRVVEGQIANETGTVAAPVLDDERVDSRWEGDETSDTSVVIGADSAADIDTQGPEPDEGALTRWYEARVVEYVRKLLGRGHKTETVHQERHGADPFLVENQMVTVDLSGAALSFLQGEREEFESPTLNVENGQLQLARWSETLSGEASLDVETNGPRRTDTDSPTAALVGHVAEDDRLVREEKYRVTGRRWVAAEGEAVYVVGEFDHNREGRLVPTDEVTVGRGRFGDRLEEERERLERWTRRGRAGAVALAVGLVAVVARVGGV